MGDCRVVGCEGDDKISYTCNECGLTFCSEHRLPENHNCSALRKSGSNAEGVFATGLQNKDGKKRGLTKRSDRVVRDDSSGERETNKTQSSDDTVENSEGSNVKDQMSEKDSPDERASKSSNTSNEPKPRQYQSRNQPKGSPAPNSLAERSSNISSDTGFRFRWATWLYRLVVVLLVALIVSVLVVGFTPASVPPEVPSEISGPIEEAGEITLGFVANSTGELGSSNSSDEFNQSTTSEGLAGGSSSLDSEEIEQLVHEKVNKERESQGLSTLSLDTELAEIARYHSKDMAQNDYFAHTSPDGEEMEDRYDMYGYECQADMGGNQYATGGENLFKKSFSGYTFTNEELATETVEGWMDSQGHRENMLEEYWEKEGIGVYIEEDGSETTVYVTQNFC